MSAADLIVPGFYGKMPATGDFVTRRLPADFVRGWDRWLAQHIVPLFGLKTWPQHIALRFLSGPGSFGASAGILLQSADRVGRQFPLSVVARLPEAPLKLAFADAWFESIETLALAAQRGELTPDELDAALAALPVPLIDGEGDLIDEFVAWTAHTDIFDVDQQAPQPTLEQIFAASWGDQLMQIWNQMGFPHQFTVGTDKDAHEWIVVVVKGTFDFPETPGGPVQKSAKQIPLVMADTQTGVPGYSATLWETDFAFRKPRCDVIANGCAYAPNGRPAERIPVGIKVGNWSKLFEVVGHREWRSIGPVFTATSPQPFLKLPISYDVAWGGVDRLDPEDQLPASYRYNPVGTGWSRTKNQRLVPGLRLPNTQAIGEDMRSPFGDYKPMSFGPMGRGWPGRIEYGGTYDDNWVANIFPFLPPDFDERYFQMAPPDQQIELPKGGEEVQLVNLTPEGRVGFRLPQTALPMTLFRERELSFEGEILPDTILFDPENRCFSLVWRLSQRIHRTILDFTECWIGPPTQSMLRARATGRDYVRAAGVAPEDEAV